MLKKINTEDKNLQLIQDNVDVALTDLQGSSLAGSSILKNVSLTASQDNLVPHKLGHSLSYCIPCAPSVNAVVWSPVTSQLKGASSDGLFVNVWCSANCTVNLVVG